jgi:hypothetical protein
MLSCFAIIKMMKVFFARKSTVLVFLLYMLFLLVFSPLDNAHCDQVDNLIKNLDSSYRDLRMSSIWTLGKVNDPRAFDALISALKHKDLGVRIAAADALGDRKDPKAVEPLITGLKENEETVSEAFGKALANITGKDFGQDHDKWEKWWAQNRNTVLKND